MITSLLTLCCLIYHCNSQTEYWVKPLSGSSHGCPEDKPCLTLSEYVTDSTAYFTSSSMFHFLPGTHYVVNTTKIIIENVQALSLEGLASSSTEQVRIDCKGRLMFAFVSVGDLHISGLHFKNCGLEVPAVVHTWNCWISVGFGINPVQAALVVFNTSTLVLENVTVERSTGFGLLGLNSFRISMINCKFHYNNWRTDTNQSIAVQITRAKDDIRHGGNVYLMVTIQPPDCTPPMPVHSGWDFTLNISNSEFSHGMAHIRGSGLHVWYETRYNSYKSRNRVSILIYNSVFSNNRAASFGSNMFLLVGYLTQFSTRLSTTIQIHNCTFNNGGSLRDGGGLFLSLAGDFHSFLVNITSTGFLNNHAERGSGIYFDSRLGTIMTPQHVFQLRNCSFINNTGTSGSALHVLVPYSYYELPCYVSISNSVFHNNTANTSGGAVYIHIWDTQASKLADVDARYVTTLCIAETVFTENEAAIGSAVTLNATQSANRMAIMDLSSVTVYRNRGLQTFSIHGSAAVVVENVAKVRVSNSNFSKNDGSAIMAFNSRVYLEGAVELLSNYGYSGGAFALARQSFLYLEPHVKVNITNNTAQLYGGGIAILSTIEDCSPTKYCFFQIDNTWFFNLQNLSMLDINVTLSDNRAGKMGDSIYGGNLESCLFRTHPPPPRSEISKLDENTFRTLFQITEKSQSEIAASPYKVCFCNNTTVGQSCPAAKDVSHFRGQTFHVAVMGTGQYNYASTAIVRVSPQQGYFAELGERQSIQEISAKCDNITLSIRTPEESTVLQVSVENPLILDNQQAILTVSFLSCPFGFSLSGNPPKCDCATHLRKPGVNCSIDSQLIHRPAAVWIGNYSNNVVIHSHCPFDYCKPEDNEISLHQQDEQCALNHARVLCGACQPGLSLALCSSTCMQCSNVWILLFVPFTMAGVALVILLLKCNLTVSTGTINGLIFYANIIRVNQAIFFPPGKINPITRFLAVFIAWVNLDLGIETCLFEGMTAFIKTWFQFLFPIYIWVMVGLMIIVSRYSTTVSRLTGYNTVSVLATLFLLSYAKLLRTITTTLSFTTLSDRYGHTSAVWLLDGNVGFLKGPHIALFIGSLLALLGFVLPFSLLVLFAPFLQARTQYHVQKLVNRFKPLLDAYQGPYKDKFRYWTGFMLWVRIVLLTLFASNALGDPQVNLLVIDLSALFLLMLLLRTGGVYKNLLIELVEQFFLLNLGIFAASTQFLRSLDNFSVKRQEILTDIMVGSAFSVFLGILAYHCYGYLKKAGVVDWMRVHFKPRPVLQQDAQPDVADDAEFNGSGAQAQDAQPTFTEIRMDELREPLVTDN